MRATTNDTATADHGTVWTAPLSAFCDLALSSVVDPSEAVVEAVGGSVAPVEDESVVDEPVVADVDAVVETVVELSVVETVVELLVETVVETVETVVVVGVVVDGVVETVVVDTAVVLAGTT